jgi:hypothetical protein
VRCPQYCRGLANLTSAMTGTPYGIPASTHRVGSSRGIFRRRSRRQLEYWARKIPAGEPASGLLRRNSRRDNEFSGVTAHSLSGGDGAFHVILDRPGRFLLSPPYIYRSYISRMAEKYLLPLQRPITPAPRIHPRRRMRPHGPRWKAHAESRPPVHPSAPHRRPVPLCWAVGAQHGRRRRLRRRQPYNVGGLDV